MAKFKEKEKAIQLRKAGKSYSEIKVIIGVSKGTLSAWLTDYPLSQEQIRALRDWNPRRIEHYRETRRRKREALLHKIYDEEKIKILPRLKRDLFLAGLFLYWGEGGKTKPAGLTLSNNNPAVIKAFICWLQDVWEIEKSQLKIKLHLYQDMNIENEILFWSEALGISYIQFNKPYIKESNSRSITYTRGFGHGTCNVILANAMVAKRVLMGLKVIEDYFNDGPVA